MEVTRRKNYKHYIYARKKVVPVLELESLMPKDKKDKVAPDELLKKMTLEVLSRINFTKFGRVTRTLAMESDRKIPSDSEVQKIAYAIITDALKNFLANHDVGFYDHEMMAVCIFVAKNGRHGLVIYPKLDLPR